MINDIEKSRMDSLVARAGEHFIDFLVITRRSDGGLSWRSSDTTWAENAARRYMIACQDMDAFERMRNLKYGEGE